MAEPDGRRWLLPLVGLATVLLVALPALALATTGSAPRGMGGPMMGGTGGFWMVPMALVWLLSLGALVVGASALVTVRTGQGAGTVQGSDDRTADGSDAEQSRTSDGETGDAARRLRERYVEGELSDGAFEHRMDVLLENADDEERERLLEAAERER
jgi:uncharacterized membrane protein